MEKEEKNLQVVLQQLSRHKTGEFKEQVAECEAGHICPAGHSEVHLAKFTSEL
jgi:hypothetical protein